MTSLRPKQIWTIDGHRELPSQVREAARILREGGLVAFPTETVYGLGADAGSDAAVKRIFEAKGRPADNPLIVHVAERSQLDKFVVSVDEVSEKLMERFWPGPLTLVLPVKQHALSSLVTAGLDTVAVRIPDHPVALALIAASGCPIAAPSANRSGRPSTTSADHVLSDHVLSDRVLSNHELTGRIDGVVDAGPSGVGLESTVVLVREGVVHVLRPGGITLEQLREVHPHVTAGAGEGSTPSVRASRHSMCSSTQPRAPGMKYAHYAPQGVMTLVLGEADEVSARIVAELEWARAADQRSGVLAFQEHAAAYEDAADEVIVYGSLHQLDEAARGVYSALRACDEAGVAVIFAEGWPEEGIGFAVMNRLRKACAGRILYAK